MEAKFAADRMLGRLAKWLRLLGHDTIYVRQADLTQISSLVTCEHRIFLTRDQRMFTSLPQHVPIWFNNRTGAYLLRPVTLPAQLSELRQVFGISPVPRLIRCSLCNAELTVLARDQAAGRVPDYVVSHQIIFRECPACKRVYWPGTHPQRMIAFLAQDE